jgi:predicted TIM-barrel fold metal-dependent hydrolase
MRRLPIRPKFVKAGVKNVCVHKGLFPPSVEKSVPNLRGYVDVSDVGQAAKDWPQLSFVIYHSGYRHVGDLNIEDAQSRPNLRNEITGPIVPVETVALDNGNRCWPCL